MTELKIKTGQWNRILQVAVAADPSAFYVGQDSHAVSGGRLTAKATDGIVTIHSNRLSQEELREIFSFFLPEEQEE